MYDVMASPQLPILLTQIRNKRLHPPPLTPPLPVLQTPYYLGLTQREPDPNSLTTPPASPKLPLRFVELYASVQVQEILPLLKYSSSKSDIASVREDNISVPGTPTSENTSSKRSLKGTAKNPTSGCNGMERLESIKGEAVKENIQKQWMDYCDFCSTFE